MDSDFEDLESLLSDHFGRTPSATPYASQNGNDDDGENSTGDLVGDTASDDDEFDRATIQSAVEDRARDYLLHLEEGAHYSDQEWQDDRNDDSGDNAYDNEVRDENVVNDEDYDDDRGKIRQFARSGCGCKQRCNIGISADDIYDHILSVREMSKEEKDMYMMGSITYGGNQDVTKRGKKRKRIRMIYTYSGKSICRRTFSLIYDIGRHALEGLVCHVKKEGVTARKHGNSGRKPKHALVYEDIRKVVEYIQNYADAYGLPQPAAPRGSDNIPPVYLDSGTTKLKVHKMYLQSCEESNIRYVKQSSFCEIWNNCLGHIKIASPRDDVCAACEKHRKNINIAVEENEKIYATDQFREHILKAQIEREVYNSCIKQARESHDQTPQTRYNHYTFDFSQNVSIPHYSRQMGQIYFATLRKVQIFGVRIDGYPRQLNFLVDENETIGQDGTQTHGPNAVISMLDYVLDEYSQHEPKISLHADNCPGQNKNRYLLGYLMWRILTGRQDSIEYLMQVPGHAKCLVDAGFGHLKKLYRRSNIETMDQLGDVVRLSSATNQEVRYPAWRWADWKSYLTPMFKSVHGIRKHQSFSMTIDEPGVVTMQTGKNTPEVKVNICTGIRVNDGRSTMLQPKGQSRQRVEYLYKNVRKYLNPANMDITCPQPAPR